jgi:transcriptional regulator with XRE-family HTH domain
MREKYRRLAQEKGVKNPEVAKKSGVPYSTLVDWLNGRTKKLSLETCAKLASYFDVPVSYFAGDSTVAKKWLK